MMIASWTQFQFWPILHSVLNVKAVVAAFYQEKALVGAFSVITNLWMQLFEALVKCHLVVESEDDGVRGVALHPEHILQPPKQGQ